MRTLIFAVAFLGLLTDSVSASNAIQLINKGNDGSTVYQTVNINHNTNVAAFNIYSGPHSSNAIVDYNSGIIAYHMPYKRICVVSRLNRNNFPNISQLDQMTQKGQSIQSISRSYGISRQLVSNMATLGAPAQAVCNGLTTYWATEYPRPPPLVGGRACAGINLLILNVNLCGGVSLF